jgi:hypothetical protein
MKVTLLLTAISRGWNVRTNVVVAACFLLCGCVYSLNGTNDVTVTTSQSVVQASGCRFVGNVEEISDVNGTANTSAADQVRIAMERDVANFGGNVLLLLSTKTGGYGSAVRGTGEGYWCPGHG